MSFMFDLNYRWGQAPINILRLLDTIISEPQTYLYQNNLLIELFQTDMTFVYLSPVGEEILMHFWNAETGEYPLSAHA